MISKETNQLKIQIITALAVLMIPFWNIPHTIAIRYSIALVLIISIFYFKPNWKELGKLLWLPAIWAAYLLIYTFILADNFQIAIKGFKGEWLKSILFMIMGLGAGLILSRIKNQSRLFFAFGLASLLPILTHISLFIHKALTTQSIPFGYWGLHEHHADLGYTGIQSIIFLTIYLVFFAKVSWSKILTGAGIFISILSPIIARSRAGSVFSLLTLLSTIGFSLNISNNFFNLHLKKIGFSIALILAGGFSTFQIVDADRWSGSTDRVLSGFHGNAISIICNGPDSLLLNNHLQKNLSPNKETELIKNLGTGDSYRVTTARAGIELIKEFPMGMNASKDAYAAAIRTKCLEPKIPMDHTHNGWIDTALSIGIPGVLIYASLMLMFIIFSFNHLKNKNINIRAWAVALLSLSLIWSLRAIFDSVQRDQMLEIQSFFLTFVMACIIGLKANLNDRNDLQT